MTLSCRAKAFCVENLLKQPARRTISVEEESLSNVLSSHQKDRVDSTRHNSTIIKGIKSRDGMFDEEDTLESSNLSDNLSRRFNHCPLVYQNNPDCEEHNTHDLQYKKKSTESNNKFNYAIKKNAEQFLPNTESTNSQSIIKTVERMQSFEKHGRQIATTTLPSGLPSTCFRHGEVTFCHHPEIISVSDDQGSNNVILAKLCHAELWTSFHDLGTEMIITKSGRRMFPALKVRLSGLNPAKIYSIRLDFLQPDTRKYRYVYHSSQWMVSGSGDKLDSPQSHQTSESPLKGQAICSQATSFERIKLTNTDGTKTGQVSLVSMQKFQPQVVVEEVTTGNNSDVIPTERYVIVFPQTSFMAVTAYQNHQITTLKIASNPFAKGFRESGKNRILYNSFMPPLTSKNAPWLPALPAFIGEFCLNGGSTKMAGKADNPDVNFNQRYTSYSSSIQLSTLHSTTGHCVSMSAYLPQNQHHRHIECLLYTQHDPNRVVHPVYRELHPIIDVHSLGYVQKYAIC